MTNKFQVGQTVLPTHPRGANPSTYVIVQVLPETSHAPQYRIKGVSSAVECVVRETQIKAITARPSRLRASLLQHESEHIANVVWC